MFAFGNPVLMNEVLFHKDVEACIWIDTSHLWLIALHFTVHFFSLSLSGGREHEGIVVSVQHGTAFLDFYCADAHGVAMCEIQEGYMEISWDIHTISFNGTWVAPSNFPLNSLDCCMGRERRRKGYHRTNISRIIIHQSWMHTYIYMIQNAYITCGIYDATSWLF